MCCFILLQLNPVCLSDGSSNVGDLRNTGHSVGGRYHARPGPLARSIVHELRCPEKLPNPILRVVVHGHVSLVGEPGAVARVGAYLLLGGARAEAARGAGQLLLAAGRGVGLEVVCPEKEPETCWTGFLVGTRVDSLVPRETVVGGITFVAVWTLESTT